MKRFFAVAAAACVAVITMSAERADAAVLTLQLDTLVTGTSPSGTPPWLTATFSDNMDGTVALQLTANLQDASEFFTTIAFNYLGPIPLLATTPANITFTNDPGAGLGAVVGTFTFGFDAESSNAGGGALRFNGSDVVNITLSSNVAIDASMFNVANSLGYYAAAHVNGIDAGDGSGKIVDNTPDPEFQTTVPEPASLALLALGSIGIGGLGLRRRKALSA